MELYDFHYAQVLANQLYNTDMEPEDFEELGLLAFDRIGNKRSVLHKSCVKVNNNNTITNSTLNGYKFVITGKLNNFKNRNELKTVIESNGGKVVDSINKSVNFLINNDIQSASSKNVAAKKLNVPIISEKEFLESFDLTF